MWSSEFNMIQENPKKVNTNGREWTAFLATALTTLLLGGGYIVSGTGCKNNSEPQRPQPQAYTNELLCLGISNVGYSHALYTDQEGQVRGDHALPMQKDLPNNSKPIIIYEGGKGTIHIPSNSTFRVSKNKIFNFELELNRNNQTQ